MRDENVTIRTVDGLDQRVRSVMEEGRPVSGSPCGGDRDPVRFLTPVRLTVRLTVRQTDRMDDHHRASQPGSARSRSESIASRRRGALEQLATIDAQLAALRQTREGLDDDEHDPDGVPLSAQWSRLEGLKQTKLEALAAIDEASARQARGEDDRCSVCGGPIAPARLVARPEATTCIDCAR